MASSKQFINFFASRDLCRVIWLTLSKQDNRHNLGSTNPSSMQPIVPFLMPSYITKLHVSQWASGPSVVEAEGDLKLSNPMWWTHHEKKLKASRLWSVVTWKIFWLYIFLGNVDNMAFSLLSICRFGFNALPTDFLPLWLIKKDPMQWSFFWRLLGSNQLQPVLTSSEDQIVITVIFLMPSCI